MKKTFEMKQVETLLKSYYDSLTVKTIINKRLVMLCEQKQSLNSIINWADNDKNNTKNMHKIDKEILNLNFQLLDLEKQYSKLEMELAILSKTEREILELRYRDRKTFYFISERIYLSISMVNKILYKILIKFAKKLSVLQIKTG